MIGVAYELPADMEMSLLRLARAPRDLLVQAESTTMSRFLVPPIPPPTKDELRRQALRELLSTPDGVLYVEAELSRTRERFRQAYFPDSAGVKPE